MRKLLLLLFLWPSLIMSGTTYYVSPTGSDAAAGTISAPWATWHYAFSKLNAGDILYIRGGLYTPAATQSGGPYVAARISYKNGTASSPILISAYGTEVPILDGSNITQAGWKVGLFVDGCSYINFKGLTVQNVQEHGYAGSPADGWIGGSSNHITLEQCTLRRSGGGFSFGGACDYIYFINCDSYNNADLLFGAGTSGGAGGYCNGFSQNGNHGTHVFYEGCRAWENSDDGYDNMGGAGYITYNNCWGFENGHTSGDWTSIIGDGDGFKLGLTPAPKEAGAQRICNNCVAWSNDLGGFDESQDNGPVCDMTLYNCTAYNNKRSGFGFYSTAGGYTGVATLKNCISYKNDVAGNYSQNVNFRSNTVLSNNSWQSGTVTDADFASCVSAAAKGPRKADGSLPDISFMHLSNTSRLIDAGVNVGIAYSGNAPDLGAFEMQTGSTVTIPVYVSSLVANTTPSLLEMTYNATLANIAPASSSFIVMVNSVARSVSSVAISGAKVQLSLSSPVIYGDLVTVSYSKPSTGTIQTASGGEAVSLNTQTVINNLASVNPVYVSSSISNATPTLLEMIYNLTLANLTPSASSFSVMVNSVARTVNSVTISGTKVQLTLSSAVSYGNVVTVSYSKPSSNPLQTTAGGQAISITAQPVTNNVTAVNPVYVSSSISNATPTLLEMTYNLTLANLTPSASSFSVMVNSVARTVNSVTISGTKVQLTLSSAVAYGNVVTVSYSKPSSNPLQTTSGGQAISITAQPVTNNVAAVNPVYVSSSISNATPTMLEMTYNLTLANLTPSASSFSVMVNSAARTVNSVTISGTKVQLTLSSAVAYGNAVTVAYTKPSSNPLQTTSGGQAISITAQPVTNNVGAINPLYVSSAVENTTPSLLEITYNMTLANIVPSASSFVVLVNSVARLVNSVSVSSTKVLLTLATPVVSGDIITFTYTKPSANPIQSATGAQASTTGSQIVTNRVLGINPTYISSVVGNSTPGLLEMTYNMALASIIPSGSSFVVLVNSVIRPLSSVSISGTKVQLALVSRIIAGDVVTVTYNKPSASPLQSTSGGTAGSFSNQPVTNNCVNISPVTNITSPVANTAFAALSDITITANASDPDGTISLVEFYNGNTRLGSVSAFPYVFTWNDVAAGNYTITAVATDNQNGKTVSSGISFSVVTGYKGINKHPVIHISNPRKGNVFENLSTITIDATASDPDGTVAKVEFYNGTVKLAELTASPYSFTWKDVAAGSYTLSAIATDNMNDTTKSANIEFVVGTPAIYDAKSQIINLYPNPNNGHFSIDFVNPLKDEKSEIVITDLSGKQVFKGPVLREELSKQFDLPDIKSGMYVMMIRDKEILVTKKFIKN